MSNTINTSNVRAAGSVTSSSASRIEGSGPFTGSRALKSVEANFGDRSPVYTASSHGSKAVAADRAIRA
jgi:hypothetical protein